MGLRDTFNFDSNEYAQHLKGFTLHQLRKKHHQKCLQVMVCSCNIGAGIGGAAFTFGATLVSSVYASRQVVVLEKQKKLIEKEIRARNSPVPRERKEGHRYRFCSGFWDGWFGLCHTAWLGLALW